MGKTSQSEFEALMRAVEEAGSQSELARMIGVSPTSIWKMVNNAKRMSAEFVLKAEAATGVSRHHLRPDIYPLENHAPRFVGVDRRASSVAFKQTDFLKSVGA